jgi:sugar-specific transcriptional regulator TrmB
MTDLGELGLSSYEEKAYRALLSLGSASAREVSDASGVPRGRVYDVLNGLESRELVRAGAGDPTTYAAVEPEVAVDRLLAERKRHLRARAERYEEIADRAGGELATATPTESRFWTAPLGSETAVTLVGEVFDAADDVVRSAMGAPYAGAPLARYEAEIDPFFDALDPDLGVELLVAAELLADVPPAVLESYEIPEAVEVRVTTDLTVSFDLVDGSRACFHLVHPLAIDERLGVIDVHDEELADRLDEVFSRVWADAVPVSALGDAEGIRNAVEAAE